MRRRKRRLRLKKSVKNGLKKICCISASLICIPVVVKNTTPVKADYDPALMVRVSNTVEVEKQAETKNNIVVALAEKNDHIDADSINLDYSSVSIEDISQNKKGFQRATIVTNIVNNEGEAETVSTVRTSGYVVVEQDFLYPTLELKSTDITIANDGSKVFVPEQYVTSVMDTSGILPALTITGDVDVNTDGDYTVTYKATNTLGNSVEKSLTVHVKTPQWLIDQRAAEEQARIEAERKAEEEKKAKEEAERRAQELEKLNQSQTDSSNLGYYGGGNNPYSGGWANCTYGAWQALYNERGISLPNFGNAYQWVDVASSYGYATGTTPAAGSIAVYTNHVAYVDAVDGNQVHIVEGGFNGHYMSRWVSAWSEGYQALRGYIYP